MGGKSSKKESTSNGDSIDLATSRRTHRSKTFCTDDSNSNVQRDTLDLRIRRSKHRRSKSFHAGTGYEKIEIRNRKQSAVICAAIDFGTTYSGYAYSFVGRPQRILTNKWGESNFQFKTPTVVLMDPNKQFHSFGEEAQKRYQELFQSDNHDHVTWYLFEKFNMKLLAKDSPLDRDMQIEDTLGRSMKAIDIFTAAIRFICQHLLRVLNDTIRSNDTVEIKGDTDIHWVLTVPPIWNDLSKHFMREVATKAGIPNEMLTLALEPEAALLFCQKEIEPSILRKGGRYMIVSLGGGTADITCHEVLDDNELKEICSPSVGDFDGTNVDNKFLSMLISIIGAPQLKKFKRKYMNDYFDMMTEFENKKRRFDGKGDTKLKLPGSILELCEKDVGMKFTDLVNQWSKEGIHSSNINANMIISEKYMREMFDDTLKQIIDIVRQLIDEVGGFDRIILVGGFSESLYLQNVMSENFSSLLVFPKEPSIVVLKGAVIYGHETKAISSTTCR